MKAFLKNYRQSPRKVRLVAGLIKGKRVADAFVHLGSLSKRASLPIQKLLTSAVANAKQTGLKEEDLFIDNVTVDKGVVLKRFRPRARGSASRINKRTSHVRLSLTEKNSPLRPKGHLPLAGQEKTKSESKVKKSTPIKKLAPKT